MTTTFQFCDGAESEDVSWASTASFDNNTNSDVRTGSRCYIFSNGQSLTFEISPSGLLSSDNRTTDDHLILGFAIRVSNKTPASAFDIFTISDDGVVLTLQIEIDDDLVLKDDAGNILLTVDDPFVLNNYNYVEIYMEHVATNADWELWIDGDSQGSGTTGGSSGFSTAGDLSNFNLGLDVTSYIFKLDDIYALTDDTEKPTPLGKDVKVLPFQASVGSTESGASDDGGVSSIDELPLTDAGDFVELSSNDSEWSVEADTPGISNGAPPGPSGSDDIDGDDEIRMVVWASYMYRTNGSSPDSLDQSFGNDTDTLQYADRAAALSTAAQFFFVASDDKSTAVPLSTEHVAYGIRKAGIGGRDFFLEGAFVQLLHAPVVAGITSDNLLINQAVQRAANF